MAEFIFGSAKDDPEHIDGYWYTAFNVQRLKLTVSERLSYQWSKVPCAKRWRGQERVAHEAGSGLEQDRGGWGVRAGGGTDSK